MTFQHSVFILLQRPPVYTNTQTLSTHRSTREFICCIWNACYLFSPGMSALSSALNYIVIFVSQSDTSVQKLKEIIHLWPIKRSSLNSRDRQTTRCAGKQITWLTTPGSFVIGGKRLHVARPYLRVRVSRRTKSNKSLWVFSAER